MQIFLTATTTEKNPSTLDIICGAIARLITNNLSVVPMDQVFPVLMGLLPLREKFYENSALLECFLVLSAARNPQFKLYLNDILTVLVAITNQLEHQPG